MRDPEEVGQIRKKPGYEYEINIPSIDNERAANRINSMDLARGSGIKADKAMTVCGVMLPAIRIRKGDKTLTHIV